MGKVESMGNTPRLDKTLFVNGLVVMAAAGVAALYNLNAPCIDVGCIVKGMFVYIEAGVAAVGAVVAAIGGIRIKTRKRTQEAK